MSRAPVNAAPVSRPMALDYFLILVGCSLSLFLQQISHPNPQPKRETPAWVQQYVLPILPTLMSLPVGIILLWPLFYATQRLRGRPAALSAGEWLWGVAWLAAVLLTAFILWLSSGEPPEFLKHGDYRPQHIWTIILVPTLAGIAVLIGLISLLARWQQPWTHTFGLVLLFWPVIPLAGLILWTQHGWRWVIE
jgi:hypothetical protein